MTETLLAGRYRLLQPLGAGGMGEVSLAVDTLLERRVAIKMLPDHAEADAQARARFRREALAAAALDHPFICKIFEVGESDGRSFIVMEHIEGQTLDAALATGGIDPRRVLDLALELAQALDEAHRRGVIHRDLKPSNIMQTSQGHVKVLDFGLAKHIGTPRHAASDAETDSTAPGDGVTQPGTRLGTPSYMSPEQILGSPLDPRSDVFSLGIVLHELACGRHPFRRETAAETMAAILRDQPASTEDDLDIVGGMGRVVHRMLAKACAERYQSMRELIEDLQVLRDRPASRLGSSGASVVPALREERTQLVSRDVELAELARQLDTMLLGQGGIVLLGGEPGVGKTRLARETLRLARARGCFVAVGHCYEQEGAPPYGPFVEMLDHSLRSAPQAVRAALGDEAAELSLIFPAIRRVFADVPPAPSLAIEQQRAVVFNAHLEYLRRASARSPLVLLLDDLHWADDSTLHLLNHLAQQVSTLGVLVVGTYRDVELDAARPFARTLETLLRQRLATRLPIKRLGPQGVERMLETMSGSAPPASLVKAVHAETDGNPFFVEEVFHHLREEGKLFDADGRWKGDLRVSDIDVPEGVRLVISRRLERLGDDVKKVLTAAAVIGRAFPLDVLGAIVDIDEDRLFDIVETAEQAQLLQAERGREARYTFVHELIRSTLMASVSLPRRQRMHLKVADALEALRGRDTESALAALADHLYEAGAAADSERTRGIITRAMQAALEAGAFEQALEQADRALACQVPEGSREHAIIEAARGEALWALGRLIEALPVWEEAFQMFVRAGDDEGIHKTAQLIGVCNAWLQRSHAALLAVQRGSKALADNRTRRAELDAIAASRLTDLGKFEEGQTLMASAVEEARASGDLRVIATVLLSESAGLRYVGRMGAARQRAIEAWEYARQLPDASAPNHWADYLLSTEACGLKSDAVANAGLALRRARRRAEHGQLWVAEIVEARCELCRNADLTRFQQTMQRILQTPGMRRDVGHGLLLLPAVYLGHGPEALRQLEQLRVHRPSEPDQIDGWIEGQRFAGFAWLGLEEEAREAWLLAAPLMPKAGGLAYWGRWVLQSAAVPAAHLLGLEIDWLRVLSAAEQQIAEGYVCELSALGPASPLLVAAIAAGAAGVETKACEYFERASTPVDGTPDRLLDPAVELWYGRHLASRGGTRQAEGAARLRRAADGFAANRMPIHEELARRWMLDAGV